MYQQWRRRFRRYSAEDEARFWAVWKNPFLRQRIFVHARPHYRHRSLHRGDIACKLNYPAAIHYSPRPLRFTKKAMMYAVQNRNLQLAKWLHETQSSSCCSPRTMDYAVLGGSRDIVKWVYNNCRGKCVEGFVGLHKLPNFNAQEIVEVLYVNRVERNEEWALWAEDYARSCYNFHIVDWLVMSRRRWHLKKMFGGDSLSKAEARWRLPDRLRPPWV